MLTVRRDIDFSPFRFTGKRHPRKNDAQPDASQPEQFWFELVVASLIFKQLIELPLAFPRRAFFIVVLLITIDFAGKRSKQWSEFFFAGQPGYGLS